MKTISERLKAMFARRDATSIPGAPNALFAPVNFPRLKPISKTHSVLSSHWPACPSPPVFTVSKPAKVRLKVVVFREVTWIAVWAEMIPVTSLCLPAVKLATPAVAVVKMRPPAV